MESSGDQYRQKAAQMFALARGEANANIANELRALALAYLRLAEQADRNSQLDLFLEVPPTIHSTACSRRVPRQNYYAPRARKHCAKSRIAAPAQRNKVNGARNDVIMARTAACHSGAARCTTAASVHYVGLN